MFSTDVPIARHKYYIMTNDMDWFVQARTDEECVLIGDIDGAFHTYSEENAFRICDKCNELGMDVKVVILREEITLWNENVCR